MIPYSSVGVALFLHSFSPNAQAYAALTNLTIDDTNSTYWTFAGSWHAVTPSAPCDGCLNQPDASQVYNSTWHDGALRSGSFTFQGSAVYIYGTDAFNPANISFSMSNPPITSFHYYAGASYVYRSLFFEATGLDANALHTVTWILEKSSAGGTAASFDYAVLTVDQADPSSSVSPGSTNGASATSISTTSSSASASATTTGTLAPATHKSKAGPIVGAVVAVVVGLALLGALYIYLRRRRTGRSTIPSTANVGVKNYNSPSPRTVASPGYSVEPYGYQPATIGSAPSSAIVPSPFTSPQMSTVSSSLKSSPEQPVALAPNLQRPDPGRSRDLEVEDRLRHLEALVSSSQPPAYK
ncbi:hypothetical protein DFH09DRAFT_1357686 [Mycena vulgaris]|nr:hypothetical protein DFH09DRAFT_1357686 [Mycena vulgaris]